MKPLSPKIQRLFQQWGKRGGRARAAGLAASRRRDIAMRAAAFRWKKVAPPQHSAPLSSVRLQKPRWEEAVYLEEVLSYGTLGDWQQLYSRLADQPFGVEAQALETVLAALKIYGAQPLWKGILHNLQGGLR